MMTSNSVQEAFEQKKDKIDEIMRKYEGKERSLIAVLQDVQD